MKKNKKAVFIIVDGVAADVIEKQPTPNLQAIAKVGGYTRSFVGGERGGYSQTPTISAVGYDSVLTGTWVNKHNVWDNDIARPNYHYPTIFRLLKEKDPRKKTAIYSSWLDNRTKLVGDRLHETGGFPVDIHFDGLELDTVKFPHDAKKQYMLAIDNRVADFAAESLRTQGPDLSWVYLEFTDDMGHMYGDSPEFFSAVTDADRRVGLIWSAILEREKRFNEEWLIVVTTDHGRDPATGKGHGGQSDRERSSWIFTNAKGLNAAFGAPQTSAVDIMPTLARFLDIKVRQAQLWEVDGVPLIGNISAHSPTARLENGRIEVGWRAVENGGKMRFWMSETNQMKTGVVDRYRLVGEAPVAAERAVIDPGNRSIEFAKIVLDAPHNTLNRWIGSNLSPGKPL